MKHRMAVYILCALVLFSLSACSRAKTAQGTISLTESSAASTPADPAATDTAKPTIALVMKTLTNPFFVSMEIGARQAEAELGINLIVKTGAAETSVEQQIALIHDLIVQRVDAIVIAPADSTELIPVLKEAQKAGIVVVNVDNPLNTRVMAEMELTNVPIITVDNEQGAYLSASYIAKQIEHPTEAIILEGIRSASNAEDRKNGALRAFGENAKIELVAMETANWKIDEAYEVTARLFKEHPEIGLIFAANDMMGLGALRYLSENGRADVLVAAYDALDEAKAALRAGTLQSTIDQQAALQAYTAVGVAQRMLHHESVAPLTVIDVKLVTAANVDE